MNQFTLGFDISVWQTNEAGNPQYYFEPSIAKQKGMHFAFVRASIGSVKDNAVDGFAKRFKASGLPVGFYHFLRSDVSYTTQADRFLNTIKEFDYQLPPVCDVEHAGLGLEIVKAFCGRVSSKLGVAPIIYAGPGFWNRLKDVAKATWALEYKYWVAHYMKLSYPVYDIPFAVSTAIIYPTQLLPWSKNNKPWTFWQFCAAGDGEHYGGDYAKHTDKTSLDMNAYNGTLEQFTAEFKLAEQLEVLSIVVDPPVNTELSTRLSNLETWARSVGYKG